MADSVPRLILALPLIVYCVWVFSLIWGQHDLSYPLSLSHYED